MAESFKGSIAKAVKEVTGATFWVKKTVTSSAVLFATPTAITSVAVGGELAIEDIVIKTNTTGLATGTTFRVVSDNSKGTVSVFLARVGRLGASTEKNFDTEFGFAQNESSLLGINKPTILELGKKLSVQNTDADSTGAGTIDIYIKFRKLSDSSRITAA